MAVRLRSRWYIDEVTLQAGTGTLICRRRWSTTAGCELHRQLQRERRGSLRGKLLYRHCFQYESAAGYEQLRLDSTRRNARVHGACGQRDARGTSADIHLHDHVHHHGPGPSAQLSVLRYERRQHFDCDHFGGPRRQRALREHGTHSVRKRRNRDSGVRRRC